MPPSSQFPILLRISRYQDYAYEITDGGVAMIRLAPILLIYASKLAIAASGTAILISVFYGGLFLERFVILLLVSASLVSYFAIQLNRRKLRRLYNKHLPLPRERIIPWSRVSEGELRGARIRLVTHERIIQGVIDEEEVGLVVSLLRDKASGRIRIDEI